MKAYIEIFLATIIWGFSGVFVKFIDLPSTTLAFLRSIVPTIIVGLYLLYKRKSILKKYYPLMILVSFLHTIKTFLFFTGYNYASVSNAIIIVYTWPIFAVIFSFLILKERLIKIDYFYLFLSFIGVVVVYSGVDISFSSREFIGMTAMVFMAILHSLVIVIFKKTSKIYTKTELIFYQNFLGAILFLPFIFINPIPSLFKISIASFFMICIGLITFLLFYSALKKIKAGTASILTYLEAVFSMIFAIILLHEQLTWFKIIGAGLIIFSTIMIKKD